VWPDQNPDPSQVLMRAVAQGCDPFEDELRFVRAPFKERRTDIDEKAARWIEAYLPRKLVAAERRLPIEPVIEALCTRDNDALGLNAVHCHCPRASACRSTRTRDPADRE
jgi:hypothetical protein